MSDKIDAKEKAKKPYDTEEKRYALTDVWGILNTNQHTLNKYMGLACITPKQEGHKKTLSESEIEKVRKKMEEKKVKEHRKPEEPHHPKTKRQRTLLQDKSYRVKLIINPDGNMELDIGEVIYHISGRITEELKPLLIESLEKKTSQEIKLSEKDIEQASSKELKAYLDDELLSLKRYIDETFSRHVKREEGNIKRFVELILKNRVLPEKETSEQGNQDVSWPNEPAEYYQTLKKTYPKFDTITDYLFEHGINIDHLRILRHMIEKNYRSTVDHAYEILEKMRKEELGKDIFLSFMKIYKYVNSKDGPDRMKKTEYMRHVFTHMEKQGSERGWNNLFYRAKNIAVKD